MVDAGPRGRQWIIHKYQPDIYPTHNQIKSKNPTRNLQLSITPPRKKLDSIICLSAGYGVTLVFFCDLILPVKCPRTQHWLSSWMLRLCDSPSLPHAYKAEGTPVREAGITERDRRRQRQPRHKTSGKKPLRDLNICICNARLCDYTESGLVFFYQNLHPRLEIDYEQIYYQLIPI